MDRIVDVKWEAWEDILLHRYACEKPYKEIASMLNNKTDKDCIHRRVDWLYSNYASKINRKKALARDKFIAEKLGK